MRTFKFTPIVCVPVNQSYVLTYPSECWRGSQASFDGPAFVIHLAAVNTRRTAEMNVGYPGVAPESAKFDGIQWVLIECIPNSPPGSLGRHAA